MSYTLATMPRKVTPTSAFGERLFRLRSERGITQTELAEAIGSSQRAISHYETVADFPPANVVVDLAKALGVSADELLGLKQPKPKREGNDTEQQRLWRKFRQVLNLPEKDRRAIIPMINSLAAGHASDS